MTTKDEILQNAEKLMPTSIEIDNTRLSCFVDVVYQDILNYCNRVDFPNELILTASQLVVELVTEEYTTFDNSRISSMSEDGRTINFDMNGISIKAEDKISKIVLLKRFKKLYRSSDDEQN